LSVGIAGVLALQLVDEVRFFSFLPDLKVTFAFLILLILGLLYTKAPIYGMQKIQVLGIYLVFFILYSSTIAISFNLFVKFTIFWGIMYLGLLVANFGDPYSYLVSTISRAARLGINGDGDGAEFNPIWVARYLGHIFLFVFFYVWVERKFVVLNSILLLMLFLYLIATGSKGPTIALIAGLVVFLGQKNFSTYLKFVIPILFFGLFCFILLEQINFFESKFFLNRFSAGTGSVSSRENFIGEAFSPSDSFAAIFGNGTGAFGYIINNRDTRFYPHNIFAEIFCENGLLGVICFLVLLAQLWRVRGLIYNDVRVKLIFSLSIYYFLNAQTSGDLGANQYFFFSYLLLFTMLRVVERENKALENLEKQSDSTLVGIKNPVLSS